MIGAELLFLVLPAPVEQAEALQNIGPGLIELDDTVRFRSLASKRLCANAT